VVGAGLSVGIGGRGALVHHRRRAGGGPGRGDSGVAALEELAGALRDEPLRYLELGLVVAGCGEAHAGGLLALLEQHRHEWVQEETYVVVLEHLDQGRLVYGTGERLLDGVSYRSTLPALAERIARRPAWRHVRGQQVAGFTGALIPTLGGMRAVTLTAEREGDGLDTGEATIREGAAFAAELAWLLDSDLVEQAR